jgi:hypothetical protein
VGSGTCPSVKHTRNSDRKRRRENIFLISTPGTFSLGLQTQDRLFVKLCLDPGQPMPPLGRERRNESFHQHSTWIRFAQFVVANQCNVRNGSWEGPINGSSCHTSPMLRLPLLDVDSMARTQSQHHPNGPVPSTSAEDGVSRWSIQEILAATDPTLVIAVRCIIARLKLSCFPESERASVSGAGPSGTASASTVDGYDIIIRLILYYFRTSIRVISFVCSARACGARIHATFDEFSCHCLR